MQDIMTSLDSYLQAGSAISYLAVFVGGVLVSFTPCVYPVIPITVGYIGGRSRGSRTRGFVLSLAYVVGIAAMYSALGLIAALTGMVFGEVGSHPASYVVAGNVTLLLALSLLDVFQVPVPTVFSGIVPRRAPEGIAGAFLVGMVAGLIMSPCTAPVLGAILMYVGSRQNVPFGMSLLFVFALGLGLLQVVLGTFSGLLANLPKSGEWTVKIKKGFGWFLVLVAEYLFIEAGKLLL